MCTRTARWVRRRDRAGRVLVVPNQAPGAMDRYGITREEADRSAWVVDRDGRRWEGAAAVNRVLVELGGAPSALAKLYQARMIGAIEEAGYRWLARNRSRFNRFGVRPECEEPGAGCQ
ncbi:MAG: thiol-disulfide oxidoreductase DCC family protein [Candidatus Dormibacteraceae bacterium]